MLRSADTLEKISGVRPVGLPHPRPGFQLEHLSIEAEWASFTIPR